MFSNARSRAAKKGIEFDLDIEFIRNLMKDGVCAVTGLPFDMSPGKHPDGPSLDRRDSSLGYTRDNVRVILYRINVMAHDWGIEKILETADAIRAARGSE
jgi:hypothetical protein